jgi:hypothetical protein
VGYEQQIGGIFMVKEIKNYCKKHSHSIIFALGVAGGAAAAVWILEQIAINKSYSANEIMDFVGHNLPDGDVLVCYNNSNISELVSPINSETWGTLLIDKNFDVTQPFTLGDYEFVGNLIEK